MIHTIWKYVIVFGNSKDECRKKLLVDFDAEYLYIGNVKSIPRVVSEQVAEIHPNYQKYYNLTMMPLYKHYKYKSGTESPILSILSKMNKKEENSKYIAILKLDCDENGILI